MVSFLLCCVLLSSFLLLLSPSCVSPSCVLSCQDSSTYASHSLNNRATYTTKPFSKTMTITYGTCATCTFVAWIYLYICCLNPLLFSEPLLHFDRFLFGIVLCSCTRTQRHTLRRHWRFLCSFPFLHWSGWNSYVNTRRKPPTTTIETFAFASITCLQRCCGYVTPFTLGLR